MYTAASGRNGGDSGMIAGREGASCLSARLGMPALRNRLQTFVFGWGAQRRMVIWRSVDGSSILPSQVARGVDSLSDGERGGHRQ